MTLFLTMMEHWILFLFYLTLLSSLAGVPNTGLGVQNMFHDDPELFNRYINKGQWGAYFNCPSIVVQAWIVVYVTLMWGFIYTLDLIRSDTFEENAMAMMFETIWPYILITSAFNLALGMFSVSSAVGEIKPPEQIRCCLGVALGLGLGWIILKVAAGIEPIVPDWPARYLWEWDTIRPTIAVAIPAGIIMIGLLSYKRLISGLAIVTLFSLLLFLYAVINTFREGWHPILIVGLLAMIVFFSNFFNREARLKFSIGGIELRNSAGELVDHYDPKRMLDISTIYAGAYSEPAAGSRAEDAAAEAPEEKQAETSQSAIDAANKAREQSTGDSDTVKQQQARSDRLRTDPSYSARLAADFRKDFEDQGYRAAQGIDPWQPLQAWHARATRGKPKGWKPKLVLVATSGGAYRASFWTAMVLDRLATLDTADEMPGICSNIRLITGASGGMVGGAYFTVMMGEDADDRDGPPKLAGSILDKMQEDILEVQQLGTKIPRLVPSDTSSGNMVVVEEPYPYQKRYPLPRDSLSAVAQQLVQRDIPALFSAGEQKVDRGKVLEDQWLTLDRSFNDIQRDEALGIKPSIVFSPMLVETGQPLLIGNLDMDSLRGGDKSDRAVFFDWFADSRDTFKLKTAVRLNAAFPYIAPSSALPTNPYRRVVDAGYYDNYGVDLAVSYLSQPVIRDWVIDNTSGVMVLQIRAFPFVPPWEKKLPGPVARGLQWLTTPIEGLGSARGSTMKFRNSQSFRRLESTYYARTGGDADFLQTAAFEVESRTSLSWYMPYKELADMQAKADGLEETEGMKTLRKFWKRPAKSKVAVS